MVEGEPPGGNTFLTRGLESLVTGNLLAFDVIIVGSGYGAALAVSELAPLTNDSGEQIKICVLERGKEYLDGSFPKDISELAGHVRVNSQNSRQPTGNRDGLFDIRSNADAGSLIANGFGGGSLINAGVMIEPLEDVFKDWPHELNFSELPFEECKTRLKSNPLPKHKLPRKFAELDALTGRASPAHITVYDTCNGCGNCATGCNFGHKASLDRTLFESAAQVNSNIQFITGATVHHLEQTPDQQSAQWTTIVKPTVDNLAPRYRHLPGGVVKLTSQQVIVAAGTFGSTEIMMNSKDQGLPVSDQLGQRFSSNGDMLAVGFKRGMEVNAVSRSPLAGRGSSEDVGPTITGFADFREDNMMIQEMAVPFPIHAFFDEIFSTSSHIQDMIKCDNTRHSPEDQDDPFSLNAGDLMHTSVYAVMSKDPAQGELIRTHPEAEGDGTVTLKWPELKDDPIFQDQIDFLSVLAATTVGGNTIANPLWKPLPKQVGFFTGGANGPLFTVHPLGGCAMADDVTAGVTNHLGQVFDTCETTSTYSGLVILDGSIIPTALGANPALTISALSLRAIRKLKCDWDYQPKTESQSPQYQDTARPKRPVYRQITTDKPADTEVQIVERMGGELKLAGSTEAYFLEITIASKDTRVRDLVFASARQRSILLGDNSFLRVYEKQAYDDFMLTTPMIRGSEHLLDELAVLRADLRGDMTLFRRRPTWPTGRILRTFFAYLLNRGLRDLYQRYFKKYTYSPQVEPKSAPRNKISTFQKLMLFAAMFNRAGEQRGMDYRLTVGEVSLRDAVACAAIGLNGGDTIMGHKLITYQRAANPLRQMSELTLDRFGQQPLHQQKSVLSLQTDFLAREGTPLIKIVSQRDTPTALTDLMALTGYTLRMLLSIHGLTFRLPDRYTGAPLSRLPDRIPGVPNFSQIILHTPEGKTLPAVLTRYEVKEGQPILLMHGYSASGTTFSHQSLDEPVARHLFENGFDVWILDARTSPGLPSASDNWTFDEVGAEDIPAAVQHIHQQTGKKLDVLAHCMGAGMFSMAVLRDKDSIGSLIRRAVLTQVGPGVVVSPGNTFRAYALRYFKQFLKLDRFDFRVDNQQSLADELIDRALNLLPYSEADFKRENPAWPPWKRTEWVGIRHRMDMLWGETFKLDQVTEPFLQNIDAMFGTLNLDTLSQVIPLSKWMNITSKSGENDYCLDRLFEQHWCFKTLSLHSEHNGLWSPSTLTRSSTLLRDCDHTTELIRDFGHQDIWLSQNSKTKVYDRIVSFLQSDEASPNPVPPALCEPEEFFVRAPHLGPILSEEIDDQHKHQAVIRYGASPNVRGPFLTLLLEVTFEHGNFKSVVDLNQPDWIVKIWTTLCQPKWEKGDSATYEIRAPIERGKQYLLLLVSVENPALAHAAFDPLAVQSITTTKGMMSFGERASKPETELPVSEAVQRAFKNQSASLHAGFIALPVASGRQSTRLVFGSCQYSAAILDEDVAFDSYQHLATLLRRRPDLIDGLFLLGDQIYTDATAGLFDPTAEFETFAAPYRKWLTHPAVKRVLRTLPSYMMLDDHEIQDNWEPGAPETDHEKPDTEKVSDRLHLAREAFVDYQFGTEAGRDRKHYWGPIRSAPLPVFMLNTRTQRQPRHIGNWHSAGMLGTRQFDELKAWLAQQDPHKPKIITSSSMLLPRRHAVAQHPEAAITTDSMDGYPATREALMSLILKEAYQHVVFVSGDEHLGLVADITLTSADGSNQVSCWSIHTPALYSPFSFANASAEDFVLNEMLSFGSGNHCQVSTEVLEARQGFTCVQFLSNGGQWQLQGRVLGERVSFTRDI